MKRHIFYVLVLALSLAALTPVGAQLGAGPFEADEDSITVIVAGNSTGMEVVWVSDPNAELVTHHGTPVYAQWSGQLTSAEKTIVGGVLASHEVDCTYRIWKPRKERGRYHTFVKNKSWQHCRGHDVHSHYTGLNLQARPDTNDFFYTQETGTYSTLNGNSARVNLSHQCVLSDTYQWRSEGWGTVYFNDNRHYYLPVVRTGHRNFCF